jgi:hypothetical protein
MAKKKVSLWLIWIPFVAGIAVTPVVVRMASVLALSGPGALTLLYPWAEIFRTPMVKITAEIGASVAQWAMYLQFPIYGLVVSWMMRKRSFGAAVIVVACVHLVCIAIVMGMAYLASPNVRILR